MFHLHFQLSCAVQRGNDRPPRAVVVQARRKWCTAEALQQAWEQGSPQGASRLDYCSTSCFAGFTQRSKECIFAFAPERRKWAPKAVKYGNENLNFTHSQVRAGEFRKWVQNRPEKVIVAFGHSCLFKELTSGQKSLRNCEVHTMSIWVAQAFGFVGWKVLAEAHLPLRSGVCFTKKTYEPLSKPATSAVDLKHNKTLPPVLFRPILCRHKENKCL